MIHSYAQHKLLTYFQVKALLIIYILTVKAYEEEQVKYKKGPPDVENAAQTEIYEHQNIEVPIVKGAPPERGTARIEDPHLKLEGGNRCPHGVAMTDYCEPCGRINGG